MSFMQVIDKFDEVSKRPKISDEIKEYAEVMKKIFIGIEQTNIEFSKGFNKILDKNEQLN